MPDLTFDKLIFFVFAVAPGFIALQVYGLKCPSPNKDWSNSLVEVITYSLVNLSLWIWWVLSLIRRPFDELNKLELTAAFLLICVVSPASLSLGWFYLRTRILHRWLGVDHPTPRGWEHFVRNHHEYWVLFHLKTGKMLGGYFGGRSYAATYPQEPEIYVEEVWRVDERGEFIEKVEGTLGCVVRAAECERIEFLNVEREAVENGRVESHPEGAAGSGRDGAPIVGGPTGSGAGGPTSSHPAEGRVGYGGAEGHGHASNGQMTNL